MIKSSKSKAVVDYWHKWYCKDFCTLCGNCGLIDSRGVKTNAGKIVGRLNFCICPNGQSLRRIGHQPEEMEHCLGKTPGTIRKE